jgi:membrane-bound ClpP family serine protease
LDLFRLVMGVFSFVEGVETLQGVIFIVGLLLLVVEMFTPGIGFAGGGGIILLIIGIIMTARTSFEALMMVIILVLLLALLLAVILRSAKKGKLSKKLILWSASRHEEGFSTSDVSSQWIGQEGVALTILRPAGTGEFSGHRLDVVTDGAFIESGVKIKIIRTEGRRIVVEPVK